MDIGFEADDISFRYCSGIVSEMLKGRCEHPQTEVATPEFDPVTFRMKTRHVRHLLKSMNTDKFRAK